MPAKNLDRKDKKGTYSHIFNKGVENKIIFKSEEDYKVFQDFLKDYLSSPLDRINTKKNFTVNGKVFSGTPHLPKNYYKKVELIAYSLNPDRFHLILRPLAKGALEKFIRSICTRYSIYYNKKYKRTGSLFGGPYKSVEVKDEPSLLQLTKYLHHTGEQSSYENYLGLKENPWVRPNTVLSYFGGGANEYRHAVENYELEENGKELIKDILLEKETKKLERSDLSRNTVEAAPEIADLDQYLKPFQRIPEALATAIVFLFLVAFGIRNVTVSSAKSADIPQPVAVLSEAKEIEASASPSADQIPPKIMVTVKIDDGSESVNIRSQPTVDSEKVGQAVAGDTFEFLSVVTGWYEIKLADGTTGYIFEKYINK